MNSNLNWRRVALLISLGVAALALIACEDKDDDAAATMEGDGVQVVDAWARATAGNPGENTAIYAHITNHAGEDDVLTAVKVGEDIAAVAEVHEMIQQGDNMVMQQIEGGLPVAAGAEAALEPGGYHVMLMNVPSKLEVGQTFAATFVFEHAGEIEVQVEVREASATGSSTSGMGH